MKLFATLTAILTLFATPAMASHGFTIEALAKDRAEEVCYDVTAGAPVPWSMKKNLTVGFMKLAEVKGIHPRKLGYAEKQELASQFANSIDNKCSEVLEYDQESKQESRPQPKTNNRTTL